MARKADLHRFFWVEVADTLRIRDSQFPNGDRDVAIVGTAQGWTVKLGAWGSGGNAPVEKTVVRVEIVGLPLGLEVDGIGATSFSGVTERVICPRCQRVVSVKSVPVVVEGLRLEQLPIDLTSYLTPARREAICSMIGDLVLIEARHELRHEVDGLPYPSKRVLAKAVNGDYDAVVELWEARDKMADLASRVVASAEVVADALALDPNESEGPA